MFLYWGTITFDDMSDGTKGIIRACYVNGITLLLSAVGDPMILFALVMCAMNIGAVLTILYLTCGSALEGWVDKILPRKSR